MRTRLTVRIFRIKSIAENDFHRLRIRSPLADKNAFKGDTHDRIACVLQIHYYTGATTKETW